MPEVDSFNYQQFNSNTLNQLGIKIENFDTNKDKKIDNTELGNLLRAGKISHVSQILTKDSVSAKVSTLTAQINSLKSNIDTYSAVGAAIGGAMGFGAAGLAGAGAIASTALLTACTGGGIIAIGAAGYLITKAFINAKVNDLEKELDVYRQTLSKM